MRSQGRVKILPSKGFQRKSNKIIPAFGTFGMPKCWQIVSKKVRSLLRRRLSMSVHAWEEIVKQIEQEADSAKIAELAKKLNKAMVSEEKEKVKHRFGISADVNL